jgi:hypothetical protein
VGAGPADGLSRLMGTFCGKQGRNGLGTHRRTRPCVFNRSQAACREYEDRHDAIKKAEPQVRGPALKAVSCPELSLVQGATRFVRAYLSPQGRAPGSRGLV